MQLPLKYRVVLGWDMAKPKYGKIVSFRATETEMEIIEDYRKSKALPSNAEALKGIIKDFKDKGKRQEKFSSHSSLPLDTSILSSARVSLPQSSMPKWLEHEIENFLMGKDSKYIKWLLALKPDDNIQSIYLRKPKFTHETATQDEKQ